jgi:hypothetical protein
MSLVDLIAIAFWPVVLAILWRAWRLRADPPSCAVPLCAAAILVGAAVIATLVFDIVSLWVLFDIYAGMILFGGLCLSALYARWAAFSVWKRTFVGLFSLALIGVGAGILAADHLMPRRIVEGPIDRLFIHHTALGPNEYNVSINGRLYRATTRLYATLRVGELVRAEIGRGSEFIYRLERKGATSRERDGVVVRS